MYLGIFSTVITGGTPEEVVHRTHGYGLRSVQFVPRGAELGVGFDTERAEGAEASFERWAQAYRREGIEICGVGGYLNILHPDPERRRHNIATLKSYMRGTKALGCRYISTETGTYAPTGDWDFDPRNRTPAAWEDLHRVTDELLAVAVQENVVLLYEPYIVNVCSTPELGATFVRDVNSEHLAMLMDPTNWFEADMVRPELVRGVIERGFAAERGLFRLAHAKDVTPAAPGSRKPGLPGPGQGMLDYGTYVRLLKEHGYTGPLIIEHLHEPDIPDACRYVQGFIDRYS
jgi:sugar phosphate isomerase/epimerase